MTRASKVCWTIAALAALGTMGCAADPQDDGTDDSSGAFTIGGGSWLQEGMYDLEAIGGGAGQLLVRKHLTSYDVSINVVRGRDVSLLLPQLQSVEVSDKEARVNAINCVLSVRKAEKGKLSVVQQSPTCGNKVLKVDGVYAPRVHAKILGTYSDGTAKLTITQSTASVLSFSFDTGGANARTVTDEAEFYNAFLSSTKAIEGKCKIGIGNPEAPFKRATVYPTSDCKSLGFADKYELDRK